MGSIDTAACRNPLPSRRHIARELSLDTSGVHGQHNVCRASTHRQKVAMLAPCHYHIDGNLMGRTGFPKGNERLPVERKLHMEIHDIQVLTDSDNK
ncbi:hypothetical protein, partial [Prevotella denticola]|uniref:hypothetical protein n=1 Tax=Prevotella denticola TaxID=28129 RepID=UPI0028DCD5A2